MKPGINEIPINRDLFMIYDGVTLLGQARKGLDGRWYPELPAVPSRELAVQQVLRAHHAMVEFS